MVVLRTERYIINTNNVYYTMLDDYCFRAKNLYNHANYIIRKEFIESGKWVRYQDLDRILKNNLEFPNYRNMPSSHSAQHVLRLIDDVWDSFFRSIKDWSKNKGKYLGKPKLPKYKNKNGRYVLILTNQVVSLCGNILRFPKTFKGFEVKVKCTEREDFVSLQQVRFIPKHSHIVMEVIYKVEVPELNKDNGRYLSIDIGLDNLATVVNNFGKQPFIINGKGLKSVNKYYNKQVSHYQEVAKRMNNLDYTNRMYSITERRNRKVYDYMHKVSRFIVDYAKDNNVSVIVIGKNDNWKQKSKLSKRVNQTFVQIPFQSLIDKITYKAQEYGIQVITHEESYTSGTSFLDNELPIKRYYDKSRRVYRGLFKSNSGKFVNADVNGAYQIMKKVFPNAYANGVEGMVLCPSIVDRY